MRRAMIPIALAAILVASMTASAPAATQQPSSHDDECRGLAFVVRTLDGRCNNLRNPARGAVGTNYLREAPANYADGIAEPVDGPNARMVSNRVFNDVHQNLFSENSVTQWGFTWGQFLDHSFGLREIDGENAPMAFDSEDPLEEFENDLGQIPFVRSPAAPGTGTGDVVRQHVNTVSSYIDAWAVYGGTEERLEWLRQGRVDGDISNNSAKFLLDDGLLPRRDARGDPASAPFMELQGRLLAAPEDAMVAGDLRANDNMSLTATHNLFALEHNRIVDELPDWLPTEAKFEIARRVVGAEQQFITYEEFLPALGVDLPAYEGYNRNADATLGNEFAVVGYRAHSMIHGEFEPIAPAGHYTPEELEAIEAQGVEIEEEEDGSIALVVPLNLAFFNPDIYADIGLGPVLRGLGGEPQYKNDEQIDNQLRSVLFEIPVSGNPECLDGPTLPECFDGVVDLGAIDVERGRDHGMPTYNDLREAFGLEPQTSFTDITGESTAEFPTDPEIDPADPINDPDIMDFVQLFDKDGNEIPLGSEAADSEAVTGIRRTTLAARLKAIYGSVDQLDAFVGMVSEQHVPGTEFGELQLAIWTQQFGKLRDGDRFFYLRDPVLRDIEHFWGISYRNTLADVIELNTDVESRDNVFVEAGEPAPASPWQRRTSYAVGDEVIYGGEVFRCRQAHTSQFGWEPPRVLALWLPVTGAPAVAQFSASAVQAPTPNGQVPVYSQGEALAAVSRPRAAADPSGTS